MLQCSRCAQYFFEPIVRRYNATQPALNICGECYALDRPDALEHSTLLRCPLCRHTWHPDFEESVWEEGSNEVFCPECDYCFTVTTTISFSFECPALQQQGDLVEGS